MAHFPRGNLKFEFKRNGTVDGAEDTIESFTCLGRRTGSNPVLEYKPFQPSKFLQPEEIKRVQAFGKKTANENLSMATLQQELEAAFKIKPLKIDLTKVPQSWRRPEKCHDVVIVVVVRTQILTIDAIAAKEVTLEKVVWPAGDSVASFRIYVPDQYEFRRYRSYNEKCCPLKDGHTGLEYLPDKNGWSDGQFVEFGELKAKLEWGLKYDMGSKMYS